MKQGNPNATAAAVTTALAWLIYRLDQHYSWLKFSSSTSILVAGMIITGILFIGRKGIWPTLKGIWFGATKTISGPNTNEDKPA